MAAKIAQQAPEVPLQDMLAETEKKIFGKTVLRDAAGEPMERGHGSNFQKLRHADRSHYLTLAATAAAEEANQHAAALSAATAKMIRSQKDALSTAQKAAEDAAIAEINAAAARAEIATLTDEIERAKTQIIELKAEIAKLKEK